MSDTQATEVTMREKLIDQHKQTLTNLDNFVKMVSNNLGGLFATVVSNMREVINNQGMELILQRQLEHGIRERSLTPDDITAILDEIVQLRQAMITKAKAIVAEAEATTKK